MNEPQPQIPAISVLVPTSNGEKLLPEALDSLVHQTLPPERYEIIVIDNDSTDGTEALVKQYIARNPNLIRLVPESNPGLCFARNKGIRSARAPIIAFIDDDARAAPQWLSELLQAFENPAVGAAGGPIENEWTCERPPWWESGLDGTMGRLDLGAKPRYFKYPRTPIGSNMAVRRSAFEAVGLFRERMGYRHNSRQLLAGAEVELLYRISNAGYRIYYAPGALIKHLVIARKLNRDYLRRQAEGHGRSAFHLALLNGKRSYRGFGLAPYRISILILKAVVKNPFRLRGRRQWWFASAYAQEAWSCLFHPPRFDPPPGL
jgi:glycosyltransferase involved in cell wall biosynthesis